MQAILLLCFTYALWFAAAAGARRSNKPWGPDSIARCVEAACRALGRLMGLTFSVVYDGVDPHQSHTCVVATTPHGAFPLAQVGLGMMQFRVSPPGGISQYLIGGASILFFVPILREFLLLGGVRSATRKTLQKFLGDGITVGLNPGGNFEMTSTKHDQEQLFAQRGLGFVRIAMEAGVPIVPMYAFGENQLFTTYPLLLRWRLWVVRRLRIGAPLFTGRWGVPFLLVPVRPSHVTLVVGRPVDAGPPNAAPSASEVQAVFERYVDEIARIFETHAARCLPKEVASRGLLIEWIGHGRIRHVHARALERDGK